jgi:hypothetical protein
MLKNDFKIYRNKNFFFLHADFLILKMDEYFELPDTNHHHHRHRRRQNSSF